MKPSREAVEAMLAFNPPTRIPRYDYFLEYSDTWRARLGPPEDLTDITVWGCTPDPFPSLARTIKTDGEYTYTQTGWGQVIRTRPGAYFLEILSNIMDDSPDPDALRFEPADLASRYRAGYADEGLFLKAYQEAFEKHYLFGKTGGIFHRCCHLRGEENFLMDIGRDPFYAKAIAERVADLQARCGAEMVRRWPGLKQTGVWIGDDMGTNHGPVIGPVHFERIFMDGWRHLIKTIKDAGAARVILHSDGDIRPLLPLLIEAGLDGIQPVERRANMNAAELRKKYPKLIMIGGMCNTITLIRGTKQEIEVEAKELIDLGREGGFAIGTHSISPDVPLENYAWYCEVCDTYGDFSD